MKKTLHLPQKTHKHCVWFTKGGMYVIIANISIQNNAIYECVL